MIIKLQKANIWFTLYALNIKNGTMRERGKIIGKFQKENTFTNYPDSLSYPHLPAPESETRKDTMPSHKSYLVRVGGGMAAIKERCVII